MYATPLLVAALALHPVIFGAPPVPVATGSAEPALSPNLTAPAAAKPLAKTPPELVAEALVPRPGAELAGQPLSLAGALASSPDRARQLDTVRAYWRLVEAVGEYHAAADASAQLAQIAPRPEDAMLVTAAEASGAAALREAELGVIVAQHELLGRAGLPLSAGPPLPSDRPHAGPYRTNFQQLQAVRTLSARAALVDQTLPIRRRAMDARASAASAAGEAVRAAIEAYRAGRLECAAVLARVAELRRQRVMFIALVRQYNDDIADYALEVAGPSLSGAVMVGMLIETSPGAVRPLGYERGPAETPLAVPATGAAPVAPPIQGKPVPVIRLDPSSGRPSQPGLKPAAEIPLLEKVNRLDPGREPAMPTEPMYSGLAGVSPAAQTRELAAVLYAGRGLEDLGRATSLAECLSRARAGQRAAALEQYWHAGAEAARYQVFAQQAEWIAALAAAGPSEPATAAWLRAVGEAAEASRLETQVTLLEAEFALAARLSWQQPPWPLPTTVPHCGACPIELRALPEDRPDWRLAAELVAVVPKIYDNLGRHAAACVAADGLRASLAGQFRSGRAKVEPLVAAIHRQGDETLRLVKALDDYNRAVGEYALAVLPATTTGEQLAALLVPAGRN